MSAEFVNVSRPKITINAAEKPHRLDGKGGRGVAVVGVTVIDGDLTETTQPAVAVVAASITGVLFLIVLVAPTIAACRHCPPAARGTARKR